MTPMPQTPVAASDANWSEIVAPFKHASVGRSVWQAVHTFGLFAVLWYAMYRSLAVGYWLTLLLTPIAAGLLVRLFIILHDCSHGSFFPSKRANHLLGNLLGPICWVPFAQWRTNHAQHHAVSSDLGRRMPGEVLPLTIMKYHHNVVDVLTLTVNEYRQLTRWERGVYRVYRHPLFLFGVVPTLLFVFGYRFPEKGASRRIRWSVYGQNLALLAVLAGLSLMIGWRAVLAVEAPIIMLGATFGIWLFYIQHQFEDTYWAAHDQWNYELAALHGSSLYRLPRILQWFTGNIGFHHIHHLSPRIPNYQLEACHNAHPLFAQAPVLTLRDSLRSLHLRLWDEERQKLVGWKDVQLETPTA